MTMTKTKRDNTIKNGTVKTLIQRLQKWKRNRKDYFEDLDNELIEDVIKKLEKVLNNN